MPSLRERRVTSNQSTIKSRLYEFYGRGHKSWSHKVITFRARSKRAKHKPKLSWWHKVKRSQPPWELEHRGRGKRAQLECKLKHKVDSQIQPRRCHAKPIFKDQHFLPWQECDGGVADSLQLGCVTASDQVYDEFIDVPEVLSRTDSYITNQDRKRSKTQCELRWY